MSFHHDVRPSQGETTCDGNSLLASVEHNVEDQPIDAKEEERERECVCGVDYFNYFHLSVWFSKNVDTGVAENGQKKVGSLRVYRL